jgi:CheY-like chemotaxis protein
MTRVQKMNKKKILVVDDEPDMLKLISFQFEKSGYIVIKAVNGEEALRLMRNEKPDLVILDFLMPVMTGDEVCKKSKIDEALKNIPILLFTVNTDTMTVEKAKNFGASYCMTKPFDPEELMNKVEHILTERVHRGPIVDE